MADLSDGESVEMTGSARRPYVLKNVGGVYSCSCPAWRNQSRPIERRTCKHLRRLRGEAAEAARVGEESTTKNCLGAETIVPAAGGKVAPPVLLAEAWDGEADLAGWWMSEKLDGVRAWFTGREFLSRSGNKFHVPDWFQAGLPTMPLDGELWVGRKAFQRTVAIVRRQDRPAAWDRVRFLVFDAPEREGPFEERLRQLERLFRSYQPPYACVHPHVECTGRDHLRQELARVEAVGGEGLMFRRPRSLYEAGRSATLVKVKTFRDAEARVVGHEPGKGRHKGRLGALLVELPSGVRFAVGTGLSDAQRQSPPPVGSTITFRYQELTDGGVPRFPVYAGVRAIPASAVVSHTSIEGDTSMPKTTALRRFEFVGGGSDKFWAVAVHGTEVVVNFGRTGSAGQTTTKQFPDAAAARKHAEALVRQKTGKGYVEVTPPAAA